METTEKNNTANKTLVEYYKASIDVHVNYLLMLNTCKKISGIGYLELAPLIESIRTELYERVEKYKIFPDVVSINDFIESEIAKMLKSMGIEKACKYIGYNLDTPDMTNLTVAVMLRKKIFELVTLEDTDEASRVVSLGIADLKESVPTSNLKVEGVNSYEIASFLASNKVRYDEEGSIIKYIYDALVSFSQIIDMLNYSAKILESSISREKIDNLLENMQAHLNPVNAEYLCDVIDSINNEIKRRKTKKEGANLKRCV